MRPQNRYKPESTLADTQPTRSQENADNAVMQQHLETLLHEARVTPNTEAAMEYVQRAVDMQPDDPRVQSSVQLSVFKKLNQDAFLAFVAETDRRYVITFRKWRPFTVPKARNEQEAYPPQKRTEAERAMRMMWWLLLGLIPAGLGAVILSPFAIGHGIRALQTASLDPQQHRMAWAAIWVALALGLIGVFFGGLLLLHFYIG